MAAPKFHVYKDKKGEWRWYLMATNGNKVANSGEGYGQKRDCLAGIKAVQQAFAPTIVVAEDK